MMAFSEELSPFDYKVNRTLPAKIRRRLTQWQTCKPLGTVDSALITFSFDDFPKSACDTGADIMDSIGAKAIYFACTGLAGKNIHTGEQFHPDDLRRLVKAGHEIGAHTHTHLDCANAPITRIMADIDHNLSQLSAMGLDQKIAHFAYPYGETTTRLKTALKDKFQTCRGILAGQNTAGADRMQLRAMELSPDTNTIDRAINAIETALTRPVWLHIFTHDVRQKPSDFGVTPATLSRVARAARDSGIPIVTPTEAMLRLYGARDV